MFDQSEKFHSFKRPYRTVRNYVSRRKKGLTATTVDAALPLEAIPSTAQIDFETAQIKYQSG